MERKDSKKLKRSDSSAQLPSDAWCPICDAKMVVSAVTSKLKCLRHGVVRPYFDFDPKVAAAVAQVCDEAGIVDLEGA